MGKSDTAIFEEYSSILKNINADSVAFLGFHQENAFTNKLNIPIKHFYDLSLGNWNINDDWLLQQSYDLIICTRCAYFSKNPQIFIDKVKSHLSVGGQALIDWGLGDHWRFRQYKVGWVRNNEQEYAYQPDNFLYSCFWNQEVSELNDVKQFWEAVKSNKKFNYSLESSLDDVVKREVPKLVDYKYKQLKTKFLWPESPQLYIITLIDNKTKDKV